MELDSDSRTPLIHAVLGEKVEAVISILYHYRKFDKKLLRQLIHHPDKYGYTAGYYASLARNQKICMILNYFEPLISFQRGSGPSNIYTVSMMDLVEYLMQSSCRSVLLVHRFVSTRLSSIWLSLIHKEKIQSPASPGILATNRETSASSDIDSFHLSDRFPYLLTLLSMALGLMYTSYFFVYSLSIPHSSSGEFGAGWIFLVSFVSQVVVWLCMYTILTMDPGYVRPHPSSSSACYTDDAGWRKYQNYGTSNNNDPIKSSDRNLNRYHPKGGSEGHLDFASGSDLESGAASHRQVSDADTSAIIAGSYMSYELGLSRIVEENKYSGTVRSHSAHAQTHAHSDSDSMTTHNFGAEELCCHYCRIYRPYRAGHSSVSGKCVLLYDHFCVMLNSDIGRDNYWLFILFCVVMATVTMPTFAYLSVAHVRHVYSISHSSIGVSEGIESGVEYVSFFSSFFVETSPYLFYKVLKCHLVWTMLIWCAIAFTLASHTYFMSRGLTSREVSMMQRYDNLSYLRNNRNAFGRMTITENILERLFPVTTIRCECYSWDEIVQMKRSTQTEYTLARVSARLRGNIMKWWKNVRFQHQAYLYCSSIRTACLRFVQSCLRRWLRSTNGS